jgi:hypothetical protein
MEVFLSTVVGWLQKYGRSKIISMDRQRATINNQRLFSRNALQAWLHSVLNGSMEENPGEG